MSRVLVTGANGFAGSYMTAALQQAGHDVYGLVKNIEPSGFVGADKIYRTDLSDFGELERIVGQIRPERVIHLAAISHAAHGDVADIYMTNLLGSRNLLEAVARHAPDCGPILLMSSANVYGNRVGGVIDEQVLPDPVNDYAVSKLGMEYLTHIYADRLSFVIVRPFNYTGIGQSPDFIIPKIVQHIRKRAKVIELGNLDVARDFSDVRFVARACLKLIDTPAAIGEKINLCSGKAYTLAEILDMARTISGHDFEVEINPQFVRKNEIKSLWGSREKLNSLIGVLENTRLEETLRWMLAD